MSRWRLRVVVHALVSACVLVVGGACGQPDDDRTTVVGVLPNGTRYELRAPPAIDLSVVQGISAVPVWASGPPGVAGKAVGVTNSLYQELSPSDSPNEPARVTDGRFTVRAGPWIMGAALATAA
jgi:hypothetical protein